MNHAQTVDVDKSVQDLVREKYFNKLKIFAQIRAPHLGNDHPALGLRQHELGLGQRGEEVAALKIDTYLDITQIESR